MGEDSTGGASGPLGGGGELWRMGPNPIFNFLYGFRQLYFKITEY